MVRSVFLIFSPLGLSFIVIDHHPGTALLRTLSTASESVSIGRGIHGARRRLVLIMIMARPVVSLVIVFVAIIPFLVRLFILSIDALGKE